MYTIETLDIRGYHDMVVPNTFFRQDQPTSHLAIIYPGIGYTAQMPVLYYPSRVLLARGADVLRAEYAYNRPEFRILSKVEQDQWFHADVMAAYHVALAQRNYRQLTLVGKSLGTLALGHLLSASAHLSPIRCLWLTPLLRNDQLREQIRRTQHRALFVIGTADPHYDPAYLADVQSATKGRSVTIEGADHSLEIGDDIIQSLHAQARIIEAVEQFLKDAE